MKIYVITEGSYSDYHICAVTDDPKKAELFKKRYDTYWSEATIEEYDTDDCNRILKDFDPNRLPYSVLFTNKGEVYPRGCCRENHENFVPKVEVLQDILYGGERIRVYLYAPDEKAAVKIAAEKRAQFLVEREGL